MKSVIIILLTCAFALTATAGTSVFTGYRYDTPENASNGTLGVAVPLGSGIYSITHLEGGFSAGKSAAVLEYFASFKSITPELHFGLIAGPGIDWLVNNPGDDPVAYLRGAVGCVLVWDLPDNIIGPAFPEVGLWGAYNQKFDGDQGNQFHWGNTWAVGLKLGL